VSDTKKWTAMMSRKPELDLGGQVRKIENQRVQIKRLTEKNASLCSALAHSKTRIEELEAEVARLRMIVSLLDAYARGEPSQPPVTGAEKRNINTGDTP
jgi:predicted RNase H-like nuclease (RuvC/YqgF family)